VRLGDAVVAVAGVKPGTLAELYRLVWSQGEAGVRIPLALERSGAAVDVVAKSGHRDDYLRKPSLQ
jgi:hypothetical protein